MHLTRFGFNAIVVLHLLPLVIVDFIGNTINTGVTSDYYYYKCIFDGLLVGYASWQMMQGQTAHVNTAKQRTRDDSDDVVAFEKIGSIEYIYCALLSVYAAANWFFLHSINKDSTGLLAIVTLAWSILSVVIAILAAVQFYHLKSGQIVELKKKVLQTQ